MAESFSLGTATLQTQIDLSGLNKGLSEAEAQTKSSLESAATGGLSIFGGIFAVGLGNLISGAIQGLTSSVSGMFGTMIEEAQSAERTQAQLGAVIASTGGKAGITAQMANELAASIQKTSTVSDDAVIAGENMLLTFTGIGKDVFPQATRTMVDMATAMNGGATPSSEQLSKTAIMLGKALQDPVKGAAALKKVGVALSEQQVEQIKTFNASGDAMAAQKLILNELATEFGGSAAAATHTYSGAMEMLKNTFLDVAENAGGPLIGSMHNLATTLSSPVIVEAVAAVANVLSGALASAIDFIAGLLPTLIQGWQNIAPAVQGAWDVLQGIGQVFGELAGEAGGWGSNIIDQLANGIMAGVGVVVDALNYIGSMITDLLIPHSPPNLLPDLDKWGEGAANVYMEGWGKADFSVFNGLSDAIKNQLESIAKATGNKNMGVASMVLGSQDAIAQAINEVHTMGNVSDETFQKIITAAGPAGQQVVGMARAYIDLERSTQDVGNAQKELNDITDEYAAKLAPLNADLKKIQDQKQAIQDAIQIQKLNAQIADSKTTAQEREVAQLAILEIQKKQEIKTTQDAQAVDVGAAKQKLEIAKVVESQAKQQVDAQKGLLDVIKKQNDSLAAQMKATTAGAGAHKSAGTAVAGHAVAQNNLMATVQKVTATVQTANANVTASALAVRAFLAPAIQFVTQQFQSLGQAFASGGLAGAAQQLVANLGGISTGITNWINALTVVIATNLLKWGTAFVAWVAPYIPPLLAALGQLATSFFTWVVAQYAALLTKLGAWGTAFVAWIAPYIPPLLVALGALATQILNWLAAQIPPIIAKLIVWGQAFIAWVAPQIPPLLNMLGQLATQLLNWLAAQIPPIIAKLIVWGQAFIAWVAPQIPPLLSMLGQLATQFFNWLAAQVPPLLAKLQVWGQQFIAWIVPMAITFLAQWPGFLSRFLDWIAAAAGPLIVKLATWAAQFIAWIIPMIPPFLVALAGVAVAILAWVISTAAVLMVKVGTWAKAFYDFVQVEVLPKLPGWLWEIGKALQKWADEAKVALYTKVIEIGTQLVAGIRKGVEDAWSTFTKWLHDQIMLIPEAVRTALGIRSPSAVMATQVGLPIIQGVAKGMMDNLQLLQDAATGVSDALLVPLKAIADAAHQIVSDALGAATSTARQAISNFDELNAMVAAYQAKSLQANEAMNQANGDLMKAQAIGAANITAAKEAFDQAQAAVAADVQAAHDKYATAIANTEDALKLLHTKMSAAVAGSIAYDALANQIAANERKLADQKVAQAKAEADAAAGAAKEKAALEKATADAAKSIADAQDQLDTAMDLSAKAGATYLDAQSKQMGAQSQLAQAQRESAAISATNAQAGADYLTLRSKQILELTMLDQQQADARNRGDTAEVVRLETKRGLIGVAQQAELAQFQLHADDLVRAQNALTVDLTDQSIKGGDSIVKGIVSGLVAGTGQIVVAIQGIMQAAIDAAKKAAGIASPSRVFAVEIGQPIAEGMAVGVQAKAMMLADATAKTAQGSLASASSTINNYNLSANYRHQGEQSLRDDVVMLSMMKGRK